MTRPTRTNPEYAAMAYRKALLGECVAHLTRLTSSMGDKPQGKVVSEDVVREDSEVPQEEVQEYILELQQESEALRLEMRKFDFVKREKDGKPEPKAAKDDHSGEPVLVQDKQGVSKRPRRPRRQSG